MAIVKMASEEYVNGKVVGLYTKPAGGIPKSDMASDVRTSLGKADTALQEHQSLAAYVNAASYDSTTKKILLKHDTTTVAEVDATAFIKDGMVSSVEIEDGKLVITFNTDAGLEPIEIPLTDIFDPANYYDKTAADGKFVAKADVAATVTQDGVNPVKSSGIWSAIWGALAALPTGFSSLYDWCVAQLAGKANKSDVDPLLFARYYPDGSVKSAAEFTPGIKYDAPNTVNRTITVKPFCDTGDSADNNSSLVGRVVIPPFVDGDGNPYISDDGTKYKVVGVSDSATDNENVNLTAIIAPNTVTNIGVSAFYFCSALASVSLPAATTIGEAAFVHCRSLVSVSLPAATNIGVYAFSNCIPLTSVSLSAATTIGFGAFIDCPSLTSVDFGDTPRSSVPTLGSNAFINVPTTCKIIVPYTQYDAWIAADGWKDLPQEFVRHAEKADKPATFTTGNLAKFDSQGNPTDSQIPKTDVAVKGDIPYNLGEPTVIGSRSVQTDDTDPNNPIDYAIVSLSDRTANGMQIVAAIDELRVTLPAATSGKVRDFGLRVEIGTGSAALTAPALVPIAPSGETIKLENADSAIPALADGTATAKGVTLLYFSETAPGVFVVKGEQVEEVA